jgi:hypothetical protein
MVSNRVAGRVVHTVMRRLNRSDLDSVRDRLERLVAKRLSGTWEPADDDLYLDLAAYEAELLASRRRGVDRRQG